MTATTTVEESLMDRIDRVVRDMHEAREGHPCTGTWSDNTIRNGLMEPRRFTPTCCNNR